ncbi:MAG: fibrobacter succinogenes major paralogous domain-containing protein [Bacteroidales bacterium]|nr:fibrobacter succinogenes major paralogous domain-containing protein [Bacteroidales bacterium]
MKKINIFGINKIRFGLYFLLFLLVPFSFESCEKEDDEIGSSNKVLFPELIVSASYKTAQITTTEPNFYGITIDKYGICWDLESNPDIDDSIFEFKEDSSKVFLSNLEELIHNTTYYVRAYYKYEDFVRYSDEISFKTLEIKVPQLNTKPITNLTAKSVESGGEIITESGGEITAFGICWNKAENPTLLDSVILDSLVSGTINSKIENLEVNTTYSIRAYATNEAGTGYGNNISFTTKDGIPDTEIIQIFDITASSTNVGININHDGGLEILEHGLCWNMSGEPSIDDSISMNFVDQTILYAGVENFTYSINNLEINSIYYIRTFTTNELGVSYGDEYSFSTKDGIPDTEIIQIFDITASSTNVGININHDGGLEILEHGLCWNMSGEPSIDDSFTSNFVDQTILDTGVENFTYSINNLEINSIYYIRTFTINELGVNYGGEYSFTTKDGIPDAEIIQIFDITAYTINIGININHDGGLEILEHGLCWNMSGEPSIDDSFTTNFVDQTILDTGVENFIYSINNLEINSTYYIRTFITNELGITYGIEFSFTTGDGSPVIKTVEFSEIRSNSLKSGGNVISDEGFTIIEKGVCWNTSGNPDINDFKINAGSGSESFECHLENLQEGEDYYVKAYATNSKGTAYGEELQVSLIYGVIQVQDYDGNWYNLLKIGNQIWLKESLKTTHYSNGDPIENGDGIDINSEFSPAYYFNYDNNEANAEIYGRLYTWYAALNACPDGWHMATENEWQTLINYIGNENEGRLKSTGILEDGSGLWKSPNAGATDLHGFSMLPAGFYSAQFYSYYGIGERSMFVYADNGKGGGSFKYDDDYMTGLGTGLNFGHSVRCIKDE